MSTPAPRPWEIDVSRLRRARDVHGALLQVIFVLLVLIAGAVAGLATANVAVAEVVAALADPALPDGPMPASQHRALATLHEYYTEGAATWQAGALGAMASVFLVLGLAARRRLLPAGVSRRRLVLALAAIGATYVLMLVVAAPFDEVGWRVAADRHRLLSELELWNDAVELTFWMQVPLAAATLALAAAALTPTRIALPALGVLGGVGLALVLLCKLPFGPLARLDEPPEDFLDLPQRSVRVLLTTDAPHVRRAALPDLGLAFAPPPLEAAAERAATEAARRHGARDLRGATARRLLALLPLARFDVTEHARRTVALWRETGAGEPLAWLVPLLRSPAAGSAPVTIALEALAGTDELRLGDAAIDACRALVGRGDTVGAARVKEAARAAGLSESRLGACAVAPPPPTGSLDGSVTLDGRPAAGVAVAVLHEPLAGQLEAVPADRPVNLVFFAAAPTARTGADGRFEVAGLQPGRYRLAVLLEDPRHSPDRRAPTFPTWIVVRSAASTTAPPIPLTMRFE
ncbi:MAG: hypothetical protein JXB32_21745 [Deltaproteobacteria bacterium]|nr:hypothetical protein [Deltaproteobacteria bacterium]